MKYRMRKLQVAVSLSMMLILLVTSLASATAPVYIDHFSGSQTLTLTRDGTETGSNFVADASALGGERDFYATLTGGDSGQTLEVTSNNGGDSQLRFASGTNIVFTAQVQWDGDDDATKSDIDYVGLRNGGASGVDLTSSSRDRFILGVSASDMGGTVRITVYTDSTHCSRRTITIGSGIGAYNQTIYAAPYSGFSTYCGSAADFANVGAVVMEVYSSSGAAAWDVSFEFSATGTSTFKEYGDLPDDGADYFYERYNNDVLTEALHVETALRFGTNESYESAKRSGYNDGTPPLATSDTDEDGVTPTGGTWSSTAGTEDGEVTFVVNGCGSGNTCYISGFIDWNRNGTFYDTGTGFETGERVLSNKSVTGDGTKVVKIDVPNGITINGNCFYSRFRITDKETSLGGSAYGAYYSGSVEDNRWCFGSTAVNLAKFDAGSSASSALPFAALLLPAGLGMLWVSRRRNR